MAGRIVFRDRAVAELPLPASGQREFFDARVRGFGVRLTANGSRTYFVAYRFAGKPRRYTIGPSTEIGAEKARREAEEIRGLVRRGMDPAAERKARVLAARSEGVNKLTVAQLVELYFEKRVLPDGLRSSEGLRSLFDRHVIEPWGTEAAADIDGVRVLKRLDEIRSDGYVVQANRVLTAIRKMFKWAVQRDLLPRNPCDGIEKPTKESARDRVLKDEEVQAIWRAAEVLSLPYCSFLRVLILSGQRKREVAHARWGEFDLKRHIWTIPGRRTKNGRTHDVPLSREVVDILTGLRGEGDPGEDAPVFTTNDQVPINEFVRMKLKIDLTSAVRGWVLHDLRRTLASGMARLQVPPHVIEKVLNHTPRSISGVAAVYNRHGYEDEKRKALELWAKQVMAIVRDRAPRLRAVGD